MPYTLYKRTDRGKTRIAINYRIKHPPSPEHPDGYTQRLRVVSQATTLKLAREEADREHSRLVREAIEGKARAGVDPLFADAAREYLRARRSAKPEQDRVARLVLALGEGKKCSEVDQGTINDLRDTMFAAQPSEATVLRAVITPIRSVLRYARKHMKYREPIPEFEIPPQPDGRTDCLYPSEVTRLLVHSAQHAADQFLFRMCTGGRVSESVYIEWPDIDLDGAKATFWSLRKEEGGNKIRNTKSGRRRVADLPRVVVARLRHFAQECPTKDEHGKPVGRVFRYKMVEPTRLLRRLEDINERLARAQERLLQARSGCGFHPAEGRVRALEAEARRRAEAVERASQSFDYVDRHGEYTAAKLKLPGRARSAAPGSTRT